MVQVGTAPGDIGKTQDIRAAAQKRGHDLAVFAAGCFWGIEAKFRATPGVVATAVGYTGGKLEKPTYREVCSDTTGHAEAVLIEFDPKVVSYPKLLDVFWKIHDPTQLNRQGPDFGTQYRSAIFAFGDEQLREARASKDAQQKLLGSRTIATTIQPAERFWLAEDYHQQYYQKNGLSGCAIP